MRGMGCSKNDDVTVIWKKKKRMEERRVTFPEAIN